MHMAINTDHTRLGDEGLPVEVVVDEREMERRRELQVLVDKHGSIDRASREAGIRREQFREECRALGVRAPHRGLLPRVEGNDRNKREEVNRLSRETIEEIDREIEELFAPLKDACGEVQYRLMMLGDDTEAAARFLLASERMKWWQRDMLVLTGAITLDDSQIPRSIAQEFFQARLDSMRKTVLLSVASAHE